MITPPLSDAYAAYNIPFQVIKGGGLSIEDGDLPFEIKGGGPSIIDGVLPFEIKGGGLSIDGVLPFEVKGGGPSIADGVLPFEIERGGPSTATPSLRIQDTQSKPGIQEDDWDD